MILRIAIVTLVLIAAVEGPALGDFYRYQRPDGSVVVTEDSSKIPPEERERSRVKTQPRSGPPSAPEQDALVNAAAAGNLPLVKQLVAQKAQIDVHSSDGRLALVTATTFKHKDVVLYLLSLEANVNIPDRYYGFTPLMVASGHGWEDVAQMMIAKGANVNARSTNGATPLARAAASGNEKLVLYLIQQGANVATCGYDALIEAVKTGNKGMVVLLLSHGADKSVAPEEAALGGRQYQKARVVPGGQVVVSQNTASGTRSEQNDARARSRGGTSASPAPPPRTATRLPMSPLKQALMTKQEEIAILLIRKGGVVDDGILISGKDSADPALVLALDNRMFKAAKALVDKGADVNGMKFGYPLMSYIIFYNLKTEGLFDAVKFLCDRGAKLEERPTTEGRTALMIAAANGHQEVVELLIARGAKINARYADPPRYGSSDQGATALGLAAAKGQKSVVEVLVSKGADVNLRKTNGYSALLDAIELKHREIAIILIANKADVNAETIENNSPLKAALRKKDFEVAQLLIGKDADVNAKNMKGYLCPLMDQGDIATVQFLVNNGKDLNDEYEGATPLYYAAQRGLDGFVDLFISKKADINHKDRRGRTALMAASESGHLKIITILLGHGADVNMTDSSGLNAYMLASQKGHTDAAKYLASKGADPKVYSKHAELVTILKEKGFIPPDVKLDQITPQDLEYLKSSLKEIGIQDARSWAPDPKYSSPENTWALYKKALIDGDLILAWKCQIPNSRQVDVYEKLGKEKTKEIALAMRPIQKIMGDNKRAEYRLLRKENGQDISYGVTFINIYGEWKIGQY